MADKARPALLALTTALMLVTVDVGAAQREPQPSLRVRSLSPLVLRGQQFRALERVTLTVRAGDVTKRRTVRATRQGSFTTSFAVVTADRCSSNIWASATGHRGSAASLRLGKLPQLQCPPAIP